MDKSSRREVFCIWFPGAIWDHQIDTPLIFPKRFVGHFIAFNIVRGTAPKYLLELVPRDDSTEYVKSTRSAAVPDFFKLKYPKISSINANSKLRRRRISVFLPEVWNFLPLELRSVHPIELFKTRLKTRLFKEAFDDPESGGST